MPATEPTLVVDKWSLRRLSAADEALIQGCAVRCGDYTELVEGRPPGIAAASEFLTGAPQGRDSTDLLKLGLFGIDGEMAGLLDIVPNYPAEGVWYIGLFLLDPRVRNAGLGTRLYRALEDWFRERGGRRVMLTVVENNLAGRRFWLRQGFVDLQVLPPKQMAELCWTRWEMQRCIPAVAGGSGD